MEPITVIAWLFLALMIGWVAVVLVATWLQVREETGRELERRSR